MKKEIMRIYTFSNGDQLIIKGDYEVTVRPICHSIKTSEGKRYLVNSNWLHIEITYERGD